MQVLVAEVLVRKGICSNELYKEHSDPEALPDSEVNGALIFDFIPHRERLEAQRKTIHLEGGVDLFSVWDS